MFAEICRLPQVIQSDLALSPMHCSSSWQAFSAQSSCILHTEKLKYEKFQSHDFVICSMHKYLTLPHFFQILKWCVG